MAGLQWTQLQAQRVDSAAQAAHAALMDEAQRTLQRYLRWLWKLTQPNAVALAGGMACRVLAKHLFVTPGGSAWRGAPAG